MRAVRALAWILLAVATAAAALLVATLLFLRSETGRRALLSIALPQIREQLTGRVEVARLDGDVIRNMILYDIAIYDLEGGEAVRAARLSVRWNLLGLAGRWLQVSEARAEGVRVRARRLGDGRLNLATLVKPRVEPSQPVRLEVTVERAFADGEVEWLERDGGRAGAGFSLRGGARYSPEAGVRIDDASLALQTTGASVARAFPHLPLAGKFEARLAVDGTPEALRAHLVVTPPRGRLVLDGVVGLRSDGPVWNLKLRAEAIDPAPAWRGAPSGRFDVVAEGHGRAARGTIAIERAEARLAATRASLRGRVEIGPSVEGELHIDLEARDLSHLAAFGMPGLGGELSAHVDAIRKSGQLGVDGAVHAVALRHAAGEIRRLDARVHTRNLEGSLSLRALGLRSKSGWRIDRLTAKASGDRDRVIARVVGREPRGSEIVIDARGAPLLERVKLRGAVYHLRLAWGQQRAVLDGRWLRARNAIEGRLRAEHLDLARLGWFVAPKRHLPSTDAQLEIAFAGTARAPIAQLALDGTMAERMRYRARLRYADQRVSGDLEARTTGERYFARVDLPTTLRGARPIHADLQIETASLDQPRRFLPPALAALQARARAHLTLDGTTRDPRIDAQLDLEGFKLGALDGGRLLARVRYHRVLDAEVDLTLTSGRRRVGALRATARLPFHLLERSLPSDGPLELDVIIDDADLQALPLARLGAPHPFTAGIVDARARVRGTPRDPNFEISLDAKKLATTQVTGIAARARLGWSGLEPSLRVEIDLHDGALLTADVRARLAFHRLIAGDGLRDAPIEIDATLPGYDLARLPEAAGTLRGTLRARGTPARLSGDLQVWADALALGGTRFRRGELIARFDGTAATAALVLDQIDGGGLRLDATMPIAADRPLRALVSARNFQLHAKPRGLGGLRQLDLVANGELTLSGTRARPRVDGRLAIDKGQVALAADPRLFTDGKLEVLLSGDRIELRHFTVSVAGGTLKAKGVATLDGVAPSQLELSAEARRFPIAQGRVGAWVDADLALRGRRTGRRAFSGELVLQKATANLPKLRSDKKLQSLDPLADIDFVDERARRERRERERAVASGIRANLAARIPGPFQVRSPELSTDLKGDLSIELSGPDARITGTVETQGGWFELLGRRYDIERARVGFGGPPDNPALDIRLTRQFTNAAVVVELHGTAKQPELVLASEPPIYDRTQILGILVSGDPGSSRVSGRSMDQQVVGALSGFIVGRLKDQIAPGLPIDILKVDVGSEGYTGFISTRVEIGKYVTDNIYVSYVHQFGTTQIGTRRINANQAQVEYRFKRRFEIDTMFGDAGVGSIDFYWTLRF